jgi:hypothetical protein
MNTSAVNRVGLIFVLCTLSGQVAIGQQLDAARVALQDPALQAETVSGISSAALTAIQGETSVAVEFTVLGDAYEKTYWDLAVGFKAPIDKGQESRTFADLSGLSTGTVASFKFQHVWLGRDLDESKLGDVCMQFDAERQAKQKLQPLGMTIARCPLLATLPRTRADGPVRWETLQARLSADAQATSDLATHLEWQRDAVDAALTGVCREAIEMGVGQSLLDEAAQRPEAPALCRYGSLTRSIGLLQAIGSTWTDKAEKAIAEGLGKRCREENKAVLAKQFSDPTGFVVEPLEGGLCTTERLANEGGRLWRAKTFRAIGYSPWVMTTDLSLGERSFSFLDATTLTAGKKSGSSYAISASVGKLILGEHDIYWGLGYSDERSFKAGDKMQLCQPIGTDGALRCSEAVLGEPKREHKKIVFTELRTLLSERFGLRPRINYESEDSVLGYQLQVYFIPNGDKALTGGLDFGYRDDDNDFTVGLFVGVPFSVFQGN